MYHITGARHLMEFEDNMITIIADFSESLLRADIILGTCVYIKLLSPCCL